MLYLLSMKFYYTSFQNNIWFVLTFCIKLYIMRHIAIFNAMFELYETCSFPLINKESMIFNADA